MFCRRDPLPRERRLSRSPYPKADWQLTTQPRHFQTTKLAILLKHFIREVFQNAVRLMIGKRVIKTLRQSFFTILAVAQPVNAQTGEPKIAIVQGTEMLRQCSRQSPLPIDGTWEPTLAAVQRFERLLPAALAGKHGRRFDPARMLSESARQYTGFRRNGKQYLYGSFFPAGDIRAFPEWRTKALVVCDGGPRVFGIEMELGSEQITHVSSNGP